MDVDLTESGKKAAVDAGKCLKDIGVYGLILGCRGFGLRVLGGAASRIRFSRSRLSPSFQAHD